MKLKEKYNRQEPRPKDIIEYIVTNYDKSREKAADGDEHQYLAGTLLITIDDRKSLQSVEAALGLWDKTSKWEYLAFLETLLFSVLPYPQSIKALCLYAVYKRVPVQSDRCREEYDRIIAPVLRMYDHNEFIGVYRKKNPKSMERLGEGLVLPGLRDNLDKGCIFLEYEATNMPYKKLRRYMDDESEFGLKTLDEWSLFTRTNICNKLICYYSCLNRLAGVLASYHHGRDLKEVMEQAKFSGLTDVQQRYALQTLAVHGATAAAEFIAEEVTQDANLLY